MSLRSLGEARRLKKLRSLTGEMKQGRLVQHGIEDIADMAAAYPLQYYSRQNIQVQKYNRVRTVSQLITFAEKTLEIMNNKQAFHDNIKYLIHHLNYSRSGLTYLKSKQT